MKINRMGQRGNNQQNGSKGEVVRKKKIFCLFFPKFDSFNKPIPYILVLTKTLELFLKRHESINMPSIVRVSISPNVHHYRSFQFDQYDGLRLSP